MRVVPLVLSAVALVAPAGALGAQPPPTTPPGRIVEAADGDVVIVPQSGSVAIVVRWTAQARVVYDATRHMVLLLAEAAPDVAFRDAGLRFHAWDVMGAPALPPRWEGQATIDEYRPVGFGPAGVAIATDRGTIFLGHWPPSFTTLPRPEVVVEARGGAAGSTSGSPDELEQAWRTGGAGALAARGSVRMTMGLQARQAGSAGMDPAQTPATPAPLRVGGNIKVPSKLVHADPVYPQDARDARVQGVVILEVTIDPAGVPADVRVLRSIPILDQAAVEAVRQWRYEPTLLNGTAVPVIMTVTVNFTLSQ